METKETIQAKIDVYNECYKFCELQFKPKISLIISELEQQITQSESIDSKIDELIAKSQEVIYEQAKQIAYLKESKSLLRKQIHGLCDIFRAAWKISADKRHEKALKYVCDNSILRNGENKIIIENAINIAAYGK